MFIMSSSQYRAQPIDQERPTGQTEGVIKTGKEVEVQLQQRCSFPGGSVLGILTMTCSGEMMYLSLFHTL